MYKLVLQQAKEVGMQAKQLTIRSKIKIKKQAMDEVKKLIDIQGLPIYKDIYDFENKFSLAKQIDFWMVFNKTQKIPDYFQKTEHFLLDENFKIIHNIKDKELDNFNPEIHKFFWMLLAPKDWQFINIETWESIEL